VLERKTRSMLNLCMLSALNRPHEFKLHFRGALTNGCTLDELKEVLLRIRPTAGCRREARRFAWYARCWTSWGSSAAEGTGPPGLSTPRLPR